MTTEPAQSVSPSTSDAPRQGLVGKGWLQGVAPVMIFGFFVMGILANRTYAASMPLPDKVVTQSGDLLFTGEQITHGQELFQARDFRSTARSSDRVPTSVPTTTPTTCGWQPTTSPSSCGPKGLSNRKSR